MILDLRGLRFIDSTGLAMLVRGAERLRRNGKRLVVVRGDRQIQRPLELTGIDQRLELVDWPAAGTRIGCSSDS